MRIASDFVSAVKRETMKPGKTLSLCGVCSLYTSECTV